MASSKSLYRHDFVRIAACVPAPGLETLRQTSRRPFAWHGEEMS